MHTLLSRPALRAHPLLLQFLGLIDGWGCVVTLSNLFTFGDDGGGSGATSNLAREQEARAAQDRGGVVQPAGWDVAKE